MNPTTLVEVLQLASALRNHGITFIEQGDKEDVLSYQDLYKLSLQGLHYLQKSGLKPKDELVFQVEDNRTFIILFWSCILGGIVPVPLSVGKNDDQKAKFFNVWGILNNPYLISTPDHQDRIYGFGLSTGRGHLLARIKARSIDSKKLGMDNAQGEIYNSQPTDLAFIQFSSGSTGSPKGVMLTHENLITNVAAIGNAAKYSITDSTLSWMPLTHDMGLIGFHINPLFNKMDQYLMPTNVFVRNPTLWLTKTTSHQITVICSPNFGYKYLLKYYDATKEYSWDLSSVRIIYNGAEPISEKLGQDFLNTLGGFGLKKNAMCPVYGLAEASLAVSISDLNSEIISLSLDRNKLKLGARITPDTSANALSVVNVGKAINDVSIIITNEKGQKIEENIVGHVKIKGKNVTSGYYNNPTATNRAISANDWLATGDLGFIRDGALYITGREKDVFFINGQNFYPHDLERLAEEVEGIDLNRVIISGVESTSNTSEEVVAFVFHRGKVNLFLPIIQSLKAHINNQTGIELAHVIPVKDIPKTTSGKVQRFKLVEKYRSGDYNEVIQEVDLALRLNNGIGLEKALPQNQTEYALLDMWEKLFNRSEIFVTDKFFEIGGNSLKAAELAMMVLKRFEVDLPLAVLYEHQSIQDIAKKIESLNRVQYLPIPHAPRSSRQPVSSLQRRLFYFQETNKSSTAYNIPLAFETESNIDSDLLQECIRKLVGQHDVLRTSFFQEGSDIFMKIHQETVFELVVLKGDASSQDFPEIFITPFDLTKPALFRIFISKNKVGKSVLFFDFHHIIMDGVSISFLIEELLQMYMGKDGSAPSIQYADFVHWSEKDWNLSTQQKQHWLNTLAGELPVLEMPLDKPRPKQFDHTGEKIAVKISKAKSEKLRVLTRKHDCSMHVLMFTAYSVLLHKYTGQNDFIIGMPVTIRNHPDLSRTMGMFVNNLAVKVQINPEDSFDQLLEQLIEVTSHALSENYPFDLLLNEMTIKRDMSRNPLFDTMFLYQNMDMPSAGQETLKLKPVTVNHETSKFDISLEVFDNGSNPLIYNFEYATALFHADTIQRLATHFDALLERMLIDPHAKITNLSLLSVDEYQDQVFRFNDTLRDYPGHSVLDLIDTQVIQSPKGRAIIDDKKEVSYAELASQSDAVASHLMANGLKKGDIVSLYINRSCELIVGILGVMKAGGVYLPIDTDLPEKRVQYLLSHSQCPWVITNELNKRQLTERIVSDINVLTIEEVLFKDKKKGIKHTIKPSDIAYLLYTSGTTGNPKGVRVSHKALHNYASWAAEQYIGDDNGSFPLFTSISFDLTLTSIFTPLVTGHSIVIYDQNEQEHEHAVVRILKDDQVDVMKLTPSHLRMLKDIDLAELGELRLKKMILGGESLETALAAEIYKKFDGKLTLYNEYGPTEATVGCMIQQFDPNDLSTAVPIGIPAANTQVYLLDQNLQLVPGGAKGEIYIAGSGLASDYLSDESLTSSKFISNPFRENERMYKTGDLAKRRNDGKLEYLGRADEQIKINGYRIEPDEINHCLRQYPDITDSVVMARDLNGSKKLFAYLLHKRDTTSIEETDLKIYLAERLPFYMIPARIVSLKAFPITSSGKIDHRALAAITIGKANESSQLPLSEIEKTIAQVWQDLLGAESIALDDNFFEQGGDSIKAVQIVSRLHEKGISVQVKDILTYHTIGQLIANEKIQYSKQETDQGTVYGNKAMTPIESWYFNQQFVNPSYFNQSVLLDINQELDSDLLQNAFELLISHHDGLRLNYDESNQTLFFNENHLNQAFPIPTIEMEEEFTNQLITIKSGFDIAESLLIKAAIFSKGGVQKHLFITAHHLITDGISWRILLDDLSKTYAALTVNKPPVLPQKTASLQEWQHQLNAWRPENESLSKKYWEHVKQCPFELPLDFSSKAITAQVSHFHRVHLDENYTQFLIKEAHKAYRTDVFTLLNVALAWALQEWTKLSSFIIEHENHGRHLKNCDASRTLGWFTAMYPVRLDLVGTDPKEQIKALKEQLRNVPDNGLSFNLIPQGKNEGTTQNNSGLRFNYLGEFVEEPNKYWSFSGNPTGAEIAPENHLTAKLEMNGMIMNGRLFFDLSYDTSAFSEKTIHNFGASLLSNLIRLLDLIKEEQEVHFTPSDFKKADLNQEELDTLFN